MGFNSTHSVAWLLFAVNFMAVTAAIAADPVLNWRDGDSKVAVTEFHFEPDKTESSGQLVLTLAKTGFLGPKKIKVQVQKTEFESLKRTLDKLKQPDPIVVTSENLPYPIPTQEHKDADANPYIKNFNTFNAPPELTLFDFGRGLVAEFEDLKVSTRKEARDYGYFYEFGELRKVSPVFRLGQEDNSLEKAVTSASEIIDKKTPHFFLDNSARIAGFGSILSVENGKATVMIDPKDHRKSGTDGSVAMVVEVPLNSLSQLRADKLHRFNRDDDYNKLVSAASASAHIDTTVGRDVSDSWKAYSERAKKAFTQQRFESENQVRLVDSFLRNPPEITVKEELKEFPATIQKIGKDAFLIYSNAERVRRIPLSPRLINQIQLYAENSLAKKNPVEDFAGESVIKFGNVLHEAEYAGKINITVGDARAHWQAPIRQVEMVIENQELSHQGQTYKAKNTITINHTPPPSVRLDPSQDILAQKYVLHWKEQSFPVFLLRVTDDVADIVFADDWLALKDKNFEAFRIPRGLVGKFKQGSGSGLNPMFTEGLVRREVGKQAVDTSAVRSALRENFPSLDLTPMGELDVSRLNDVDEIQKHYRSEAKQRQWKDPCGYEQL